MRSHIVKPPIEIVSQQQSTELDSMMLSNQTPERVKVSVRLRPFIEEELTAKDRAVCVEQLDIEKGSIIVKKDYERRQFNFDFLFDPKTTQQKVYNKVAQPVIESVLKGVNGTIFCYGQTGTGKTYTMMGQSEAEERGIIPRSFDQIFHDIGKDHRNTYKIYMEVLMDLIRPDNGEVRIRECPDAGVFVSGLEWVKVTEASECLRLLAHAEKNRVVAFTNLNVNSSRSHSMLMVRIDKSEKPNTTTSQPLKNSTNTIYQYRRNLDKMASSENLPHFAEQDEWGTNCSTQTVTATLHLVDLAGSERVKKSRATGDRLSEARSINYSLTALGKCIHALTDPKTTFVPFRDSKLTRILQDALGGNCKTSLIVNIGPAMKHVDETLSSLTFGLRAMKVQNMPIVNLLGQSQETQSSSMMMLEKEIDQKQDQIQKLQLSQERLVQQVQFLEREVNELKHTSQGSNSSIITVCNDSIVEAQYKLQIQRMEEEHKSFLQEIDTMMVDQENENDQLRSQLTQANEEIKKNQLSLQQALQQIQTYKQQFIQQQQHYNNASQKSSEIAVQECLSQRNEFVSIIDNLNEQLLQKNQKFQQSQELLDQYKNEITSLREQNKSQQQIQQSLQAQELLFATKERHLNEFRQETELLSANYAKLLEEKRRIEQEIQQQQNLVPALQDQISTLKNQLIENDQKSKKSSDEQRKVIDDLRLRIKELADLHNSEMQNIINRERNDRSKYQNEYQQAVQVLQELNEENGDLRKQLEQNEGRLNQMRNEYEKQIIYLQEQVYESEASKQKADEQLKKTISKLEKELQETQAMFQFGTNSFQVPLSSERDEKHQCSDCQSKEQRIQKYCGMLQEQELQVKQQENLMAQYQLRLQEQQKIIDHLRGTVDEQSSQLYNLQGKSQKAVQKLQDMMRKEVVKGVIDMLVVQVELNLMEDNESIHQSICQTPVNQITSEQCFLSDMNRPGYSMRSKLSLSVEQSLQKFHQRLDFDQPSDSKEIVDSRLVDFTKESLKRSQNDSFQKSIQHHLVESLFIEEEEEEIPLNTNLNDMAILEQSEEEESDKKLYTQQQIETPRLKGPIDSVPSYCSPSKTERQELLNELIKMAKSNSLINSQQLFSFSDKHHQNYQQLHSFILEEEDEVQNEVQQVLDRIIFVVEAKATFDEVPDESLKDSMFNESFTFANQVDKFMSRIKLREQHITENLDLRILNISSQANSFQLNQATQLNQLILQSSNESPRRGRPSAKLNDEFLKRLESGQLENTTLIKILAKILETSENSQDQQFQSLIKKAKNFILIEELEELLKMMAIILMENKNKVCQCKQRQTTSKQEFTQLIRSLNQQFKD